MKKVSQKLFNIFILSSLISQVAHAITIGLELGGELTPNEKNVFRAAKSRWQKILVNEDLPRAQGNDGYDIVISANALSIDGPGRVLGQAGPTIVRPQSHIPSRAIMKFDSADLDDMSSNGSLSNVIMHEMGHALGFGTIWDYLGLVKGNGNNPLFEGSNAKKVYARLRNSRTLSAVPIENIGGPGTAGSHWRKNIFGNELMTGFIDQGYTPLSSLTIAAFGDMGYEVDYSQADAYSLPTPVVNLYGTPPLQSVYSHTCHQITVCPKDVYYSNLYSPGCEKVCIIQ